MLFCEIVNTQSWHILLFWGLKNDLPKLIWWGYYLSITIQVRRTRHAGHCWRSKDELISDVLLWTPTYGCAKVGRPARTYIQQLCEDTGCNAEDLPEAMNDREKWRERVRDIRAGGATWWWWWLFICQLVSLFIDWFFFLLLLFVLLSSLMSCLAQSVGAVEYTDCFSAEG